MKECKYCTLDEDKHEAKVTSYNFGTLGRFLLEVWIFNEEKPHMSVDLGRPYEDGVFSGRVDIKYCPFCGKKLEAKESK